MELTNNSYILKAQQSEERVSVATMLEQYTCTRLIEYLSFSGFFQAKMIIEFLDYLFSFLLLLPTCGLGSNVGAVWWITQLRLHVY